MKKLSALQRILIPLVLIGLLATLLIAERTFSQRMQEIRSNALNETDEVSRLLDMAETLVGEHVKASLSLLKQRGGLMGVPALRGEVSIGRRSVPNLVFGEKPQTGNFDLVDGVTEIGGGTATLFVKSGDEFVRISTNVQKENGSRAIGTMLDPKGKAYAAISQGRAFHGVVKILDQPYITGYEPMRDTSGNIVGAWYVGYKVDVVALDQAIKKWNFLDSGFAAVLDHNNKIYFVSERLTKAKASAILNSSSEDWVVVRRDIPRWNFQAIIAYPVWEGRMVGLADAGFLVLLIGLLFGALIVVTFTSMKRFVLKPLGGDPQDASALVQRITEGDFAEDGSRAVSGTLMSNVLEMRRKLGEMVNTLHQNAERMALSAGVFRHAHDGIFIADKEARIVEINPAFTLITGYSREEALGKHPWELGFAAHDQNFFTQVWQEQREGGEWRGENWNQRKDGEVYAAWLDVFVVRDEDERIRHYAGVFSDITAAKEQQKDLERMAYHDPLTQLPNRALFGDRLQQALARAVRSQELIAICYFDLDGFKPVNDKLGHEAGDRLLVELAVRLRTCLRETDTIARMGGDEFALLLCGLKALEEGRHTLDRLLASINEPFVLDGKSVHVSASIGVTVFPFDDTTPDTLLRHADHAMYQAKTSGGGHYHLFDAEHDRLTHSRRQERDLIEAALENGEFCLYYQPKVDLRNGEVFSLEALIRWQHPEHGLRQPIEFLPQVEDTDFAIPLGEWVTLEALRQLTLWQQVGLEIKVSINIAARHMMQSNFAARLAEMLKQYPHIKPAQLTLEITETAAIEDIAGVAQIINSCKLLGVSFALDDFGVGYSSLTYLRRLPVDVIKIDQSFVRDMLHDSDDLAVVAGVISLSRDFKRQVIAEGVESTEHGAQLLRMGCYLAQGYGIARPMPAADIPGWVTVYQPDPGWVL